MSWTDLFKSKSSSLRPDPRVRWFGKLPTYPDYYRSPTDEAWVDEYNTWFLKGYELYKGRLTQGGYESNRLPVTACIIRLPKSEMTVFASVLDFGGDMRGRSFPICFYAGMPTTLWPGPTDERLASAFVVLRSLLALGTEVARFLNAPGSFEAMFANREVDWGNIEEGIGDTSWETAGRAISMGDWFNGAKRQLKVQDRGEWLPLVREWGKNIAAHEGDTFEPTLRFPLSQGVRLEVQAAGWFRWLESHMDLSRRDLCLIISGDLSSSPGTLAVIAREIMPDDFLLLTPLWHTLPYVDDLSVVGGGGTSSDGTPDQAPDQTPDQTPDLASGGDDGEDAGSWTEFVGGAGKTT